MNKTMSSVVAAAVVAFAGLSTTGAAGAQSEPTDPQSVPGSTQPKFAIGQPVSTDLAITLPEVNRTFTYRGHPIHPKLIYRFLPWMSDSVPIVLSVDLAAADGSNEYFADDVKPLTTAKNSYRVDGKVIGDDTPGAYFSYQWLGSPAPGVHALRTSFCGGGSGVFEDLLVLRRSTSKGVDLEGKTYDRIVLTFERLVSLGDRWDGSIRISPGRVFIGPTVSNPRPTELVFK